MQQQQQLGPAAAAVITACGSSRRCLLRSSCWHLQLKLQRSGLPVGSAKQQRMHSSQLLRQAAAVPAAHQAAAQQLQTQTQVQDVLLLGVVRTALLVRRLLLLRTTGG
jgi:hypothetical protein